MNSTKRLAYLIFQALRLTSYGKKSYCCMLERLTLNPKL